MKGIFIYVLEFMLTLDAHGFVYRVFWPSDWVIDCYILLEFRPLTTIPSTTQILCTSTKRCASPQFINRIHATHFIHTLIPILHYVMPINHNL